MSFAAVLPAGRDGDGRIGLLRRCGRFADGGESENGEQEERRCGARQGGSADERGR